MRFFCLLIALVSTSGCAHYGVVSAVAPAHIDTTGMDRIAVMEFKGDHGSAVATTLSGRLWKNEFYTVIDRSDVSGNVLPATYQQTGDLSQVLIPAKNAGVDGVILGEVVEYRCEDDKAQSTAVNFGSSEHENHHGTHRDSGFGFEQHQTLTRQGTVTIAFRLVDSRTGEVRASERISHHFDGQVVDGVGTIPSRGEVLDNLTQLCLDDIVAMLAPHEVECRVQFGSCDVWTKGRRPVQQGIILARRGDWEEAEERWENALEMNAENHAAIFNLALVAAHKRNYEEAETLAMKAIRIQHKSCYAAGLETIRNHRDDFEETEHQRQMQAGLTSPSSLSEHSIR